MDRLRELRKAKGLTQGQLAQELHVVRTTVTMWEKDILPTADMLNKIAAFFGVSVDYLIGRTDEVSSSTKKQPTAESDALRKEIIGLLDETHDLSDQEVQIVRDFVSMLKEHRGAAAADPRPDRAK